MYFVFVFFGERKVDMVTIPKYNAAGIKFMATLWKLIALLKYLGIEWVWQ